MPRIVTHHKDIALWLLWHEFVSAEMPNILNAGGEVQWIHEERMKIEREIEKRYSQEEKDWLFRVSNEIHKQQVNWVEKLSLPNFYIKNEGD